jgi:hypothetical protein
MEIAGVWAKTGTDYATRPGEISRSGSHQIFDLQFAISALP